MRGGCALCGSTALELILSLGKQPLANALLTESELAAPEPRYPLDLLFCDTCSLVQLGEVVPPTALFDSYAYFSSQSRTMVESGRELANRLMSSFLVDGGRVMEIASNDGYLLAEYARRGAEVLGIDPATNVVEVARDRGVPTICAYFSEALASSLVTEHGLADVVHANNVIAHVPDPVDVIKGIKILLQPLGIAVLEFPWVRRLVEGVAFDTIYHEHLFYYSLSSFSQVVDRAGMRCVDVQELDLHGGSLRVTLAHGDQDVSTSVGRLLDEEQRLSMTSGRFYAGFETKVAASLEALRAETAHLTGAGGRIAGYGAAAKGTVLLNAVPEVADKIGFVVDSTPYKQGRYIPGVRVPISPPARLHEDMPTHTLILAWNFAEEIIQKEEAYRERGGIFFTPLPVPRFHASDRR